MMVRGQVSITVRRLLLQITSVAMVSTASGAVAAPALRQIASIPLAGVEGRIDHMALDAVGQRLFVVALGNNTVEVLDLRSGRGVHSLTGFSEPQGVGFVASPPRLFIADGGDGSVSMLDASSFQSLKKVPLGEDADNVRVGAQGKHVYVGFGSGGIAVLDAATGEVVGRVALPAHPEAFQLKGIGPRLFVNVPDAGEVAVLDRLRGKIVAHWPLGDAKGNFPMAVDSVGKRLFIGCRWPAEVLVLDATNGAKLGALPIEGDTDDLFFDDRVRRLYASCGAGYIEVIESSAGGHLHELGRVPTAPGARTSLFDPASRRLFLAVPHRGTQSAEVRIFEVAQ